MKKLILLSIMVFGSGLPNECVIQNLIELADKAYVERTTKFIASIQCQSVMNVKNEWAIICKDKDGLVYRKDDTDREFY